MDLQIKNQQFLVTGASSGFGKAVSIELLKNGAQVLGIARNEDKLRVIKKEYINFNYLALDVTDVKNHETILSKCPKGLAGVFVNAGGPPAKSFLETSIEDWDDGYSSLIRWKVSLVKQILPLFQKQNYGRFVFIESATVKQPIPNLALSNSLRMAVVGIAKTLADEVASTGITANVICPGFHETAAMERLFAKKSELDNMSREEAKGAFASLTKVGKLGKAEDLAQLATWLLSPASQFVTGQSITIDGGTNRSVFG